MTAEALLNRTAGIKSKGNDSLKIKSYYARTVEDALVQASEEMGPDAILVHSRKTPLESRHLGPYEVVFALPGRPQDAAATANAAEGPRLVEKKPSSCAAPARPETAQPDAGSPLPISVELMQMRRQMEEIRRALAARPLGVSVQPAPESPSVLDLARRRLRAVGVDGEIATELIESSAEELIALTPKDPEPFAHEEIAPVVLDAALRRILTGRLHRPPARQDRKAATVMALVGPPGAGKTSSLVKIAMARMAQASRPVHFISADTYRIGAVEQLRALATIVGASFDVADTPVLLAQAIEASKNRELVLIDTPGLSGSDFSLMDEVASFLGGRRDIEKHLVLPATMRFRDLKRFIRQYEHFHASRVLFTRLDETDRFGSIYSTAMWSGFGLSYFSGGQQIPEHLEEADAGKLMDLLFGPEPAIAPAPVEGH